MLKQPELRWIVIFIDPPMAVIFVGSHDGYLCFLVVGTGHGLCDCVSPPDKLSVCKASVSTVEDEEGHPERRIKPFPACPGARSLL